ncbi:hypothetical protein PAXRUDRAFT_828542 [Paxillus rubicundulus Ve08.2h10]|uniref:Uncharacterized protein n=1 Tax=Paxillus rubicundulus Ve08.2h10 TaxID=930991 RepID=A0A0D0DPI9_9AGAM|nr:hypothetical protein PAXRUDRAFT_828542 [Paxillus rubicundulus Ve08.2h10]
MGGANSRTAKAYSVKSACYFSNHVRTSFASVIIPLTSSLMSECNLSPCGSRPMCYMPSATVPQCPAYEDEVYNDDDPDYLGH